MKRTRAEESTSELSGLRLCDPTLRLLRRRAGTYASQRVQPARVGGDFLPGRNSRAVPLDHEGAAVHDGGGWRGLRWPDRGELSAAAGADDARSRRFLDSIAGRLGHGRRRA